MYATRKSPCTSFNIQSFIASSSACGFSVTLQGPGVAFSSHLPHRLSTHTLALRGLFLGGPFVPSPTHWSQTPQGLPPTLVDVAAAAPSAHMLWALPGLPGP